MKKIKYLIGILILVIIIIIAILFNVNHKKNKDDKNLDQKQQEQQEDSQYNQTSDEVTQYLNSQSKLHDVDNTGDYFMAMTCANQYFSAINTSTWGTQESSAPSDDQLSSYLENIYNMLDSSYINQNNINKNDVLKYVENVNKTIFYIPLKMKMLKTEDLSTSKYVIYGIKENEDYSYIGDFYIIVYTNINTQNGNTIFSVVPQINKNYKSIDDISLNSENVKILENDSNKIEKLNITDEYITRQFTDYYKKLSLGRPELAYDLIDNQYKEKRFGSLDNYKEYLQEDKVEENNFYLKQYLVNRENNNTQYVGRDQYGRAYVFNVKTPNDYSIMLDTYTIDTDYFTKEYNTNNAEKKVQMDINKFILMINNQDWNTVYNTLDENFRKNNFNSIEDFKDYVKEKAYKYNNVEFKNFETIGDVYKMNIELTDLSKGAYVDESKGTGGSAYVYNWTINVKLGDNTDFKISFEK